MSIGSFLGGLLKKLTGQKAQDAVKTAVSLVDKAEPLLKLFATATGNVTMLSVVNGYEAVGLPVSDALRDGKLNSDELKSMASLGIQLYLEKTHKVSGSAAGLAVLGAFLNNKQ